VRLEHEAAVRGLLLPEGIDGGIVYEDPHLRLSEVLAVVDPGEPFMRLSDARETEVPGA